MLFLTFFSQMSHCSRDKLDFVHFLCSFLGLVEHQGVGALAAVVSVTHRSHEHASTALLRGTLASQPVDFTILVNLGGRREEKPKMKPIFQMPSQNNSKLIGCSF